jgi:DNA replication and repair protein RecF
VRLRRLVARGFRNLAELECELPEAGAAVLGDNAQGKTSLLEAIYYSVLFRSFRGATDQEVAGFDGPGFRVEAEVASGPVRTLTTAYRSAGRRKRILLDDEEPARLADAVGCWLAVVFLPTDVGLASGPASERRQYVDRLLSLAHRPYLRALSRYRTALAQRNSALRQGRSLVARAFDVPLAVAGAEVVQARQAWASEAAEQFASEFECLGERGPARLLYRCSEELADPSAWPAALEAVVPQDRARRLTTIGPHRDDLVLGIGGRALRGFGSTGQQRSAAVALKLLELTALRSACGTEPALLLDDVFAELDRERQRRLARRLLGEGSRQVFVTAPRPDELPPELGLPVWTVDAGRVKQ